MEGRSATIDRVGTTTVVLLSGPLMLDTTSRVREELSAVIDEHPPLLVVDVRAVEEIDSSGLALLLWMHRSQAVRGCRLVLVADTPMVLRAFSVTRLDGVLEVRAEMPEL